MKSSIPLLLVAAVFVVSFWGYPLDGVNFNTLHFLSKEPFPDFWGYRFVDPATGELDFSFLRRNEGLMTVLLYGFYALPVSLAQKLILVNTANLLVQALNVALFVWVMRKLVGPARLLPYLFLYLLYPFAAANHYWAADLPVNLAATLFLFSLGLFLQVDYAPDRLARNVIVRMGPSLLCLWLSVIMVEYAVCLSPLYVYLALYYGNGRTALVKFPRWITPYTLAAGVFLLTSVLPPLLFTGHRLTVASYAGRYAELAGQLHLPASLVAVAAIFGNAVLVALSYLFANTVGFILYPLLTVGGHLDYLLKHWGLTLAVLLLILLGTIMLWSISRPERKSAGLEREPNLRFLFILGLLWAALAYFPFLLSIGYPRNVGLLVDRINVLGSMGVVLCLGSSGHLLWEKLPVARRLNQGSYAAAAALLAAVLLCNLQIQKAYYVEGEQKERAMVAAVLDARDRWREAGREPVFILDRAVKQAFPRAQLQDSVRESEGGARWTRVGGFVFNRYFAGATVSTAFNFQEIYFFSCCPSAAPVTFNFYSDWAGRQRPLVYKREEPFRLSEDEERYVLGYASTEVWKDPSYKGEFQIYPKDAYRLVVMDIQESTFRLGGPLNYSFRPHEPAAVADAPGGGGA